MSLQKKSTLAAALSKGPQRYGLSSSNFSSTAAYLQPPGMEGGSASVSGELQINIPARIWCLGAPCFQSLVSTRCADEQMGEQNENTYKETHRTPLY